MIQLDNLNSSDLPTVRFEKSFIYDFCILGFLPTVENARIVNKGLFVMSCLNKELQKERDKNAKSGLHWCARCKKYTNRSNKNY